MSIHLHLALRAFLSMLGILIVQWAAARVLVGFVGEAALLFSYLLALCAAIAAAWLFLRHVRRNISVSFAQIAASAGGEGLQSRLEQFSSRYEAALAAEKSVDSLAKKAVNDIVEMRRLERVRSEFLGNVSHELRTPIFSIQGYLETLLDGALEDQTVCRQFVERAHSNAERLNMLLSDLIDVSKIESGEMRLSFRYFSLAEMLRDSIATLEFFAQQQNVQIIFHAEFLKEITVYGDKERLSQVIGNLVQNAIKYNVPNGRVFVESEIREKDVKITVRDTGVGIAEEHHKRVFERFYRVDKDRSRAVGGTGLGLAIVKHILEAHQTQFGLESIPGEGSKVWFLLRR